VQAQLLLVKLNPSATYTIEASLSGGDIIFTDDVSFEVFMDHLLRLVVQHILLFYARENKKKKKKNFVQRT